MPNPNELPREAVERKPWTEEEIKHRNEQYRKMKESVMSTQAPMYQIETQDNEGNWTWRMQSSSKGYFNSNGRRWVDLKFCNDYRVTKRNES